MPNALSVLHSWVVHKSCTGNEHQLYASKALVGGRAVSICTTCNSCQGMDSSQSDIRARRSPKSFAGYVHCYKRWVEQDGLSTLLLHAQPTQRIQCGLLLANLCDNIAYQLPSSSEVVRPRASWVCTAAIRCVQTRSATVW